MKRIGKHGKKGLPLLLVFMLSFGGTQLLPVSALPVAGPFLPGPGVRAGVQGLNLNTTAVQEFAKSNYWILVPDWLAGTWQAKKQTILASYNYSSKKHMERLPLEIDINRISKIGAQLDSQGRVWHLAAPNTRIAETAEYTEYQTIESVKVLRNTPTSMTIKCKAEVTRISKTGNQPLDAFKEETITLYTRLSDNRILCDFHAFDYDSEGNPLFSSRLICTEQRVKDFQISDEDNRGDLRSRFHQFLLSTGQLQLIPDLK